MLRGSSYSRSATPGTTPDKFFLPNFSQRLRGAQLHGLGEGSRVDFVLGKILCVGERVLLAHESRLRYGGKDPIKSTHAGDGLSLLRRAADESGAQASGCAGQDRSKGSFGPGRGVLFRLRREEEVLADAGADGGAFVVG